VVHLTKETTVPNACKGCKKETETTTVEQFPGVKSDLCTGCKGKFEADMIVTLKTWGFKADASAAEVFDEIKTSLL
jgi:hypothetical protein